MLSIGLIILISVNVRSDNGLFYAAIQYSGGADLITESFALYDQYGDIIYAKRDVSLNTFFISNTGSVFALNEHRLYLYQHDGSEIMLRDLVYPNGFGFSPDNSQFFASDREGLFVYSDDGNLVNVYHPGRLFASSVNGDCVAVVSTDTLFVYENDWLIDTEVLAAPYVSKLYFSVDAESIMMQVRDNIEVYDMRTGSWVKQK